MCEGVRERENSKSPQAWAVGKRQKWLLSWWPSNWMEAVV